MEQVKEACDFRRSIPPVMAAHSRSAPQSLTVGLPSIGVPHTLSLEGRRGSN